MASIEVAWLAQCQSRGRPAPGLPVLHAVGYTSVNLLDPKAGYQAFMSHNQNLVDQTSLNRYKQQDAESSGVMSFTS